MALSSTGSISLSQVQTEFGGSNPISLSEYYRNGSYVTQNNTGVPTSGAISLGNLRGTERWFYYTFSSNVKQADLRSILVAAGWDQNDPVVATVNSSVWLWSDSTSVGGLTISGSFPNGVTLYNYGKIIGKGGAGGDGSSASSRGNGQAGGPAIYLSSTGVNIINQTGAYIAGGGGGGGAGAASGAYSSDGFGGGGGAGGGAGGPSDAAAGYAGGAIGAAGGGTNGGGAGGGAGGANYGGGGGGRILPGTGGVAKYAGDAGSPAGNGGSANGAGYSGSAFGEGVSAGGGGGWGAAGGAGWGSSGGAGGKAIQATVAYSKTLGGAVYGGV